MAELRLRVGVRIGGGEIEHMEISAWIFDQSREVMDSFAVSNSHCVSVELERPIITFRTKDGRRGSGMRIVQLVENRAGRPKFEISPLLAAARPQGVGQTHACARRLEWGADLGPEACGFGTEPLCVHRIALGKLHSSLNKGRARH